MKMGYLKLVQREDERQAAMAGLMTKQLTQPGEGFFLRSALFPWKIWVNSGKFNRLPYEIGLYVVIPSKKRSCLVK